MGAQLLPLQPYRVLDLSDETGYLCGRLLADLGADVVKVEPPGGDSGRRAGPFYGDSGDPEQSLFWFAYNASKRGITLDLESAEGREIWSKLVAAADIVVESFPIDHPLKRRVSYDALSAIKPAIVATSITPFGLTGPYSHLKANDLVVMAMAGPMNLTGDADRPPVFISFPQASLHGSSHAAVATLIALWHSEATGEGQQVDLSLHESVIKMGYTHIVLWEREKHLLRRTGVYRGGLQLGVLQRQIWPCKDGFVVFTPMGGRAGAAGTRALADWMRSEGVHCPPLNDMDWTAYDTVLTRQGFHEETEPAFRAFFGAHTKAELYDGARERRILLYPVLTMKDLLESEQLRDREYWTTIAHPELGRSIVYPGTFARLSGTPAAITRRAPLIGEHNGEVYGEMGLAQSDIDGLRRRGVI